MVSFSAMEKMWNDNMASIVKTTLLLIGGTVALVIGQKVYRYRKDIQKRLQQVKEESLLFGSLMIRVKPGGDRSIAPSPFASRAHILELNPAYCQEHKDRIRLVSLGEYLSTLRPAVVNVRTPEWVQTEIDATLAVLLRKALGPYMGNALLPALGTSTIKNKIANLSAGLSAFMLPTLSDNKLSEKELPQGIPLSLTTMSSVAYVNESVSSTKHGNTNESSPLDKMKIGEVGYDPSFGACFPAEGEGEELLVPNPFIVSRDWERAIRGMEYKMGDQDHIEAPTTPMDTTPANFAQTPKYDPDDRSLPKPMPLNERLLPGLHLGWGEAECTHTKREIIQNRLLCVLLNRLGRNYYYYTGLENGADEDLFSVKMTESSDPIFRPAGFVQALMESGHEMVVVPRTQITTFGMALCVKEEDGGWSNIPLAFFLKSDYENEEGTPALVCLPHGGICMDIQGPLFNKDDKPSSCNIQFYMAIEGLCGWHSNHNANVPYIEQSDCCEPFREKDAVHAVRLAGLSAVMTNAIGTEENLPFGGYGLTGVCNDSAALIEQAMRGTTNVYPLVTSGRFLTSTVRRMKRLHNMFEKQNDPLLDLDIKDLDLLMRSAIRMSSDLHASPSNAADSSRRMLKCLPKGLPFMLNVRTKAVLEDLQSEIEFYREAREK